MTIDQVEFDDIVYPVTTNTYIKNDIKHTSFQTSINVDGSDQEIKVGISIDLVEDLRLIQGLDPEQELKNIVEFELKEQIFKHVYKETARKQLDKVMELVNKRLIGITVEESNANLQALADVDKPFAAYLRNFHKGT